MPRPRGVQELEPRGRGLRTGRDQAPGQWADGPRVWKCVTGGKGVWSAQEPRLEQLRPSSGFDAGRPRLRTWQDTGLGCVTSPLGLSVSSAEVGMNTASPRPGRETGTVQPPAGGGPRGLRPTGRSQTACWGSDTRHSAVRQAVLAPVQRGGRAALGAPLGLAEERRVLHVLGERAVGHELEQQG